MISVAGILGAELAGAPVNWVDVAKAKLGSDIAPEIPIAPQARSRLAPLSPP